MTSRYTSARNSPARVLHVTTAMALTALCAWTAAADWPDWRGPNRDGHSGEPLPAAMPAAPKLLWRQAVGHGYSGVIVGGDRLYLAEETGGQETIHARRLADGGILWSTPVAPVWNDEFEPGPRCTPVLADGRIFFQSNQGEFVALEAASGRRLWGFRFADYGAFWVPSPGSPIGAANRRGHAGSPVVAGDRVIVQVGSTNHASLCAFTVADGRLLWRSQDDLTGFSSPIVGTLGGIRQVVTATCEGLLGVAVDDGRLLWRVPFKTGANRNVLTAILDGDTVTFASHTTGFRRVRVRPVGAGQRADDEWFNRQLKINLATPVLAGDHYFGLGAAKDFVCVDRRDGAVTWSEKGFGDVASTLTDGARLLVLLDSGEVRLLTASAEKYVELGRFQACGKSFSHPAWSGGVLYVRDAREVLAYALPGGGTRP